MQFRHGYVVSYFKIDEEDFKKISIKYCLEANNAHVVSDKLTMTKMHC
jgi:hypothetical protein